MAPELYWLTLTGLLTALLPFLYIFERVARIGLMNGLGHVQESGTADFNQASETPSRWAKRAWRAHMNAVEFFPVFAALILVAHLTKTANDQVVIAAMVYFFSRLAHYILYILGIPVLRTVAFIISMTALFFIGYCVLTAV